MTSHGNDTIVDTDGYQYEVEIDNNHNNVEILAFILESAPAPSSTNEREEFVGEIDSDEITAITAWAVIAVIPIQRRDRKSVVV